MRVLLSASAAALAAALVAAPAFAADTVGRADLSYSAVRWKWGEWPVDNTDVALTGAVAHTFDNGWGVQIDGRMDEYSWDGEDGSDRVGLAAAHVFKRGEDYAVGAFAGKATFYGADGEVAGVEAQAVLPKTIVAGSIGTATFHGWSDYGLWDAQLSARHYLTENLVIGAGVGYTDWHDAQRDPVGLNLGVDAEYKPWDNTPVSVFAGWRHDKNDSRLFDYSQDTVTVGVRVNFGAKTLRERDVKGPLGGAQALAEHLLHY